MKLNAGECCSMTFSRQRLPTDYTYVVISSRLKMVSSNMDLGVILDPAWSFTLKSLKMLAFIKRYTSDFRSLDSVKLLYFFLVRPHLEYCSGVWSPTYYCHVRDIERVQRKFLRYIVWKFSLGGPADFPTNCRYHYVDFTRPVNSED